MRTYQLFLKVLALAIVAIALIHISLGASSETLLGSNISQTSISDPNLDSQNRFYGAAFMLFAAVFWLGSQDLKRHEKLLKITFAIFLLAGLSRLISMAMVGTPSSVLLVLTGIELGGPPIMHLWLNRCLAQSTYP